MIDISIVIPVYNKKAELCDCLDSILSQTHQKFECILVDDGSTDGCGSKCDQYALKDSRFKVLHKKNGGVSSARNAGIEIAQGQYLMFCDADDILPPNALDVLFKAALSSGADLILGEFERIIIDKENDTIQRKAKDHGSYMVADTADTDALLNFWMQNDMVSSVAKLYRKDITTKYGVRFDERFIVFEDYAFVIDYLKQCKTICAIPEIVYRCVSYTSVSDAQKRSRKDFIFDVLTVSEKLTEYLSHRQMGDAEMIHKKTIYPTIRYSYDILWSMNAPDMVSRKAKYARISHAVKNETFQKMIKYCRDSFNASEYFCLRVKSIWLLLLLHAFQRLLPRKKRQ